MRYDDKYTTIITDEELESLTEPIKKDIPLEVKNLVYGIKIPVDIKLPNGMSYEEFKHHVSKDNMEKMLNFLISIRGDKATKKEKRTFERLKAHIHDMDSNEAVLKETFYSMCQKAAEADKKQDAGREVNLDYLLIRPKNLKNILKIFENLVVRSKAFMETSNQKWFDTKIILRIHVGDEIELSLLAPITTPSKCLLYPFYIAADDVVYVRSKTTYPPLQMDTYTLIEADSVRLNYAVKKFNEANRFTKYHLIKIPKTVVEARKNMIGLLKDTLEETMEMILLKDGGYVSEGTNVTK